MPTTVISLFSAADLQPDGHVPWGSDIPPTEAGPATGVYVIALDDAIDSTAATRRQCPVSEARIRDLLDVRAELKLDGRRPAMAELKGRLAAFWLPSETALYIGLAGPRKRSPRAGELTKRINEYYVTPLGARTPHAGGWFLKTLSLIDRLIVHYAYCDNVGDREQEMLKAFTAGVTPDDRDSLHDTARVMPFANLEYPPGTRKRHGIENAKAPRSDVRESG